jgi:hypothetical protein
MGRPYELSMFLDWWYESWLGAILERRKKRRKRPCILHDLLKNMRAKPRCSRGFAVGNNEKDL